MSEERAPYRAERPDAPDVPPREQIIDLVLNASNDVWREDAEEATDRILARLGFTWEDVHLLRSLISFAPCEEFGPHMERLRSMAGRIAALLPPQRE